MQELSPVAPAVHVYMSPVIFTRFGNGRAASHGKRMRASGAIGSLWSEI
jgi:hypothetical protein